jgi:hypothetical protein
MLAHSNKWQRRALSLLLRAGPRALGPASCCFCAACRQRGMDPRGHAAEGGGGRGPAAGGGAHPAVVVGQGPRAGGAAGPLQARGLERHAPAPAAAAGGPHEQRRRHRRGGAGRGLRGRALQGSRRWGFCGCGCCWRHSRCLLGWAGPAAPKR